MFNSNSYVHGSLLKTLSHNNPLIPLHLHQIPKKQGRPLPFRVSLSSSMLCLQAALMTKVSLITVPSPLMAKVGTANFLSVR